MLVKDNNYILGRYVGCPDVTLDAEAESHDVTLSVVTTGDVTFCGGHVSYVISEQVTRRQSLCQHRQETYAQILGREIVASFVLKTAAAGATLSIESKHE